MLTSGYLQCNHCGCEFLASARQLKRARSSAGREKNVYCSPICQYAKLAELKRRPMPYSGTCPQCGKDFGSRYQKRFCSMKCYTNSPEFKARVRGQAHRALRIGVKKRTGQELGDPVEVECLHCHNKRFVRPSSAGRKYCSKRCYRLYMAERFDRWVASPQAIALPQSFDEFMTQSELPCLIDGCDWVGQNLGLHVNMAHGIPAQDFKRAAGFNLGTGLVSPELHEKMADRPHIHGHDFGGRHKRFEKGHQFTRNYISLEGREHGLKAQALLSEGPQQDKELVCEGCRKLYSPGPRSWNSKWCSIECRNKSYSQNNRRKIYAMTCAYCHRRFLGNVSQHRRDERGLPVTCCINCRNQLNIDSCFAVTGKRRRASHIAS